MLQLNIIVWIAYIAKAQGYNFFCLLKSGKAQSFLGIRKSMVISFSWNSKRHIFYSPEVWKGSIFFFTWSLEGHNLCVLLKPRRCTIFLLLMSKSRQFFSSPEVRRGTIFFSSGNPEKRNLFLLQKSGRAQFLFLTWGAKVHNLCFLLKSWRAQSHFSWNSEGHNFILHLKCERAQSLFSPEVLQDTTVFSWSPPFSPSSEKRKGAIFVFSWSL